MTVAVTNNFNESDKNTMLRRELKRHEGVFTWNLCFQQPLEARFQIYFTHRYRSNVKLAIVLGALMLLSGGALESLFSPEAFGVTWMVRFATLVFLGCAWLFVNTDFYRRYHQPMILAAAIFLNASTLLFAYFNAVPIKHFYYSSIVILQIFIFVLTRMQFRYSVGCAVLIAIQSNIFLIVIDSVPLREMLAINFMLSCGTILTLSVSYLMEKAVRSNFLHARILGLEKNNLTASNLILRDKLIEDSLTGAFNRRGFEDSYAEEWNRAIRNEYPLSLIMFDVDYFKQYNDTYGHIAGDECLKTLANVPIAITKRTGDLVARYGGEEFAVILVGTSLQDATIIAENIRSEVERIGIPHIGSLVAGVVTISCGVASVTPVEGMDRRELIEMADKALYAAKRGGRNRVETSAELYVLEGAKNVKWSFSKIG